MFVYVCLYVFPAMFMLVSVVFLFIFTDVFRLMLTYDFFYVYVCISFHVNSCLSMCVYAFDFHEVWFSAPLLSYSVFDLIFIIFCVSFRHTKNNLGMV